jgi:hypothetical protein
MPVLHEDNFGFYCIDDVDRKELEFFCYIKAQSEPDPIMARIGSLQSRLAQVSLRALTEL